MKPMQNIVQHRSLFGSSSYVLAYFTNTMIFKNILKHHKEDLIADKYKTEYRLMPYVYLARKLHYILHERGI